MNISSSLSSYMACSPAPDHSGGIHWSSFQFIINFFSCAAISSLLKCYAADLWLACCLTGLFGQSCSQTGYQPHCFTGALLSQTLNFHVLLLNFRSFMLLCSSCLYRFFLVYQFCCVVSPQPSSVLSAKLMKWHSWPNPRD